VQVREEVRALFLQGFTPARIADKYANQGLSRGLVSRWALSGKWAELRDGLKRDLNQSVLKNVRDGLKAMSADARFGLAPQILAGVAAVEI